MPRRNITRKNAARDSHGGFRETRADLTRGDVDVPHRPDYRGRDQTRTGEHARYHGRTEQNYSQRICDAVKRPAYHSDEAGEHPVERVEKEQQHEDEHDDLQERKAAPLGTKKPRYLADAPEASEDDHVDEPAKALLKPRTKLPDQVFHTQVPSFVFPNH